LSKYSGLLQILEKVFHCSGICTTNSYYTFSDVNKGVPKDDCKILWLDYLDGNELWVIIVASITSVFFLLSIYFVLSHCENDRKVKEEK